MSSLPNYAGPDLEYGHAVNNCTQEADSHSDDCDGSCGTHTYTDLEVDLINELKKWRRMGKQIIGVPDVLEGKIPESGFRIGLFDLDCRVMALVKVIKDRNLLTEQEMDVAFQEIKLAKLQSARKIMETAVPKPPMRIFRPDGKGTLN
jgi:hypothetical protein